MSQHINTFITKLTPLYPFA